MQQHTGQHLLSAVLDDLLELRTVSVHFGDETSTLDVADASGGGNILEPEVLARVESRVNEIVAEAQARARDVRGCRDCHGPAEAE